MLVTRLVRELVGCHGSDVVHANVNSECVRGTQMSRIKPLV